MKVLHLLSDWKWTGASEPVVSLCESLTAHGIDVTIAFRKTPIDYPDRTVAKEVAERKIPRFEGFRLNRYFSPGDWLSDLAAIGRFVREQRIDIVHTNLSHDHFTVLAGLALTRGRPLIVRTDHRRDGLEASPFMQLAFNRTDGLVTYSDRIRNRDVKKFGFPEGRTCVLPPGTRPYDGPLADIRPSLGLTGEHLVMGVIGRLKRDRGYDTILKAFRAVKDTVPAARLVIVGRSSQIEETIVGPAKELGLTGEVILAGYRREDYFDVIGAFDLFIMMRAGSDGSARALREVMAMGVPAIVSDAGMLPELVLNERTGFVVPSGDEDALASKMSELLRNAELRRAFGEEAKRHARHAWSFATQAATLSRFYEDLLRMGPRR